MFSDINLQRQTQYVIGKDDLREIINEIIDEKMNLINAEKAKEVDGNRLVKPKEAAKQLGVNLTTLWRWHKEGYLKKVYIGDKPRYRQSDIDKILEG